MKRWDRYGCHLVVELIAKATVEKGVRRYGQQSGIGGQAVAETRPHRSGGVAIHQLAHIHDATIQPESVAQVSSPRCIATIDAFRETKVIDLTAMDLTVE
jgi:hypothetical protein